tara:strand:+ start:1235 stop:1420 length:186 start_codon:yes stop_codon:yes gene_type:complete
MEKTFIRKSKGILINNNTTAYTARMEAKKRNKKQRKQEEEIEFLKAQLKELKAIVNTIKNV